MKKTSDTRFTTNTVRCSFPHIFEPDDFSGDPKYSIKLLIDKGDTETIQAFRDGIKAAAAKKWGDNVPKNLDVCLRDGDESERDEERGCWTVNAKTKAKEGGAHPPVLDASCNVVTDPGKVYGGCYVKVNVSLYAYDVSGNRGVGCGLNSVQFIRDGEQFGNPVSIEDMFDVEDEDDDIFG